MSGTIFVPWPVVIAIGLIAVAVTVFLVALVFWVRANRRRGE